MDLLEVRNMTFMPGQELNVTGLVKSNPVCFSINVGHNMEIIALHFDARFNYRGDKHTIVLTSKQGGPWEEEQRESNFPFEEGKEFQVSIVFNFGIFDIYLPNGHIVQFPDRLDDKKYKYIFFAGDAKIQTVSVKTSERATKR